MKGQIIFAVVTLLVVAVDNQPTQRDKQLTNSDIESVIDNNWKKPRSLQSPLKTDLNCNLSSAQLNEIQSYQDVVNQIIELFLTGQFKGETYKLLAYLTDKFGPRLTGTAALENSIDWVLDEAKKEDFITYTENVTVPHWVRNCESLMMVSPRVAPMTVLAFGYSIGTPPEGITAEALVVSSFEELHNVGESAAGKIIVFDVPFTSYGETVAYRSRGAVEAAKVGGVASLVRSVTDFSLYTPHTGMQSYSSDVKEIPTAAITVEDAGMLHRIQNTGEKIVLNLTLGATNLPSIISRNTILEVEGSENPEEIVVVSGHLDSWDVGNGVMDDAGGCVISWMSGKAVKALTLHPRRTLRTIMFTAEELGIVGGQAYFEAHANERRNFQLMMESDAGTFFPRGIGISGNDETKCIMREILSLTKILDTTELVSPAETPDLGAFRTVGVPTGSLYSANEHYFWYHHSPADTMDVYHSDTLDRVAALWASVAYVTADISFRLPHEKMLI